MKVNLLAILEWKGQELVVTFCVLI